MKGALGCLEGSRCGLLWRPKTSNTTLKPGAESAQSTYRQGRPRVHFGQKKLDIVICETPPLLVVLLPPPLHPRTASPLSKPQLQQISEWVQLLQTPVLILPDRLSYSSHSIHHKCSFFFFAFHLRLPLAIARSRFAATVNSPPHSLPERSATLEGNFPVHDKRKKK